MSQEELLKEFCERYQLSNPQVVGRLYEIAELAQHMPKNPSPLEIKALQELIGVEGQSVYVDYVRSGNTFELIMQWREKTGNFGDEPNPLLPDTQLP